MLETPKASTDFLANALHPELERWDEARDEAMEAVIKGYRTPVTGDWNSIFRALHRLPSAAPVLVFLEEFRAADGVKDLPAFCHIGRLWTSRERVGGPDREATDHSIACFAAWMRMTTTVSLLETTYAADVDLELILVLNIGIALHKIDKEVRMSMLIHPIFQLPALMHHWGNTGAFISHGAVKYARFVMVEPGHRDQNMTRMLNAMCAQMHPALIEFVKYVG
ncbi:hypothetical protein K438DRAFT_1765629 [Mycena galopus ATCC 62051]|nr:hypothetical protein K438DRAFT_1765629 [Mycena galopus ATCC 62051]